MIYRYKCEETGEEKELELSIKEDIPSKIEEDGKTFFRVWTTAFHIPFQWGQESNLNFNKSPSKKKHFF
jgi:predicted nucleic acid-binding Zn ribbon protein